jgi:DNA repair exonuclease SbcCD ATPase subunit
MYLKEIELENFCLIRSAHITFGPSHRVIGLVGRYEDDATESKSNRAGKTTLIEAKKYNLFGISKTGKQNHKKLINRTAQANGESLSVRCVWVLDNGEELEIIRTRSNKGEPSVSVTGHEGAKWEEANKTISDLIGFTYEEYTNTCYFGQGSIHQFMSSGPKEKRQLLLEWLDQSRWEDRADYSKQEAEKIQAKVTRLNDTLAALPEPNKSVPDLRDELTELNVQLEKSNRRVGKLDSQMIDLADEQEESAEQQQLARKEKRILETIEQLEDDLEHAKEVAKQRTDLESEISLITVSIESIETEWDEHPTKGEGEKVSELAFKIRERNQQLRQFKNMVGTCPILDESCNRIDATEQRDGLRKEVSELTLQKREIEYRIEAVADEYRAKINKEKSNLESKRFELGKFKSSDPDYIESQLDDQDTDLESVQGKIKKDWRPVSEIGSDISVCQRELREATRDVATHKAQIEHTEEEIGRAEQYEARRKRLSESISESLRELGAWQYCIYMFGDRGIPNEFIKNAFDSLESDVNYLLGRMETGLSVEFKPYRESRTKEKHCIACGKEFGSREKECKDCGETRQRKRIEQLVLNIHDANEGTVSDFSLDSGGGQVLISFAVRLALLLFKIRQGRCQTMPIVLDEIVGMLDPVNRAAIVDVVLNILIDEYDIRQVYWVSHVADTLENIENVIAVTRYGNHSIAEWE